MFGPSQLTAVMVECPAMYARGEQGNEISRCRRREQLARWKSSRFGCDVHAITCIPPLVYVISRRESLRLRDRAARGRSLCFARSPHQAGGLADHVDHNIHFYPPSWRSHRGGSWYGWYSKADRKASVIYQQDEDLTVNSLSFKLSQPTKNAINLHARSCS